MGPAVCDPVVWGIIHVRQKDLTSLRRSPEPTGETIPRFSGSPMTGDVVSLVIRNPGHPPPLERAPGIGVTILY